MLQILSILYYTIPSKKKNIIPYNNFLSDFIFGYSIITLHFFFIAYMLEKYHNGQRSNIQ